MARKVLILDTSVLCCMLSVAGKETCGPAGDRWDKPRIDALLVREKDSIFVLPLATIIETGNHIAQAGGDRHGTATAFCDLLKQAAAGTTPWAAFADQADLWSSANLCLIAQKWPALAAAKMSLGDATIKDVAEYYAKGSIPVEIVTGDAGLKAYQPAAPVQTPRRRG